MLSFSALKGANAIFQKGLSAVPEGEDREELRRSHERFQARVAKKTLEESSEPAAAAGAGEEERAVLGALRGHGKKQTVGSVRVGAAKKAAGPGAMPSTAPAPTGDRANKSLGFTVFQDENSSATSAASAAASAPGASAGPGHIFHKNRNQGRTGSQLDNELT